MTLEVLPPMPVDKGSAVRRLLLHRRIATSLYAGDDTTDMDAFAVVDVAVAVGLAEMPPGLVEAATFAVDGTEGVTELLRAARRAGRLDPQTLAEAEVLLQRPRLAARDLQPRAVGQAHPERPGATGSSATTRRRLTRYERWMRKKIVGGRASSSSRIDCVERQPLAVGVDPGSSRHRPRRIAPRRVEQQRLALARRPAPSAAPGRPRAVDRSPARSASTRCSERARRSSETGFSR